MIKRKWLRVLLIGGVLALAASFGFSRALRAGAVRRYLIAHLAASFGRPVDVSWFDFSLLDGARIEAHFVSVADDPHFGNEYFLRADTLTAGLRWTALSSGRFEFGSVSLLRPSLNLARDAEGHWNIERWLPPAAQSAAQAGSRPGFVGPMPASGDVRAERVSRIDVDDGRINFKQRENKIPFALDDVSGRVEQNGAGRWQLDLEARPMRAGVELQDIGTLILRGSIAGTSARLQPAELNLTWRDASLADTLRLARQDDYGMRGQIAVDLNARIAPPESSPAPGANSGEAEWSVSGVARLTGLHSWRLAPRGTDPAANLSVQMNWRPGEARLEIRKLLVEMPASRLQGTGDLDWAQGIHPQLHIESSTLALGDVLSWYRALQPDVAEDLRADCDLGVDVTLGGWPIQLQRGAVASVGGTLTGKSLPAPLQIGAMNASVSRGGLDFAPTEISFAPAPLKTDTGEKRTAGEQRNSFVLRGSLFPLADGVLRWPPEWNVSIEGAASRVQDWLVLVAALAHPLNSSWSASGGLAVKMRGVHRADSPAVPSAAPWLGPMDFLGLTVSPAYVNQPVHLPKGHVEFAALQRTVTVSEAKALGALWHGSISRKNSDNQWTFDLSADHLNVADLDRWLGPRARPGFLARLTGSNSDAGATSLAGPVVTRLVALGRLRAGVIDIAPMHIEQFDGEVEVAGRAIHIRKAQADFFGGKLSGSLDAQLLPDPAYDFQGRFERVDLAQLGRAVPYLNGRIKGNVSSTLALSMHGIGRQSLISSLEGQGTFIGKDVGMLGLDLSGAFPGATPSAASGAASGTFASAQGAYRIQNRGIDLANFMLDNSRKRLEAAGRIDFSHVLNIRLRPAISKAAAAPGTVSLPPPDFLLGGTIEVPKLLSPSAVAKPPARSSSRQK
jgi:hypothetical protein